jgi:hypothetical protein
MFLQIDHILFAEMSGFNNAKNAKGVWHSLKTTLERSKCRVGDGDGAHGGK